MILANSVIQYNLFKEFIPYSPILVIQSVAKDLGSIHVYIIEILHFTNVPF